MDLSRLPAALAFVAWFAAVPALVGALAAMLAARARPFWRTVASVAGIGLMVAAWMWALAASSDGPPNPAVAPALLAISAYLLASIDRRGRAATAWFWLSIPVVILLTLLLDQLRLSRSVEMFELVAIALMPAGAAAIGFLRPRPRERSSA